MSDDPDEDEWEIVAPMLTARASLGVAVLNGCLYAVGRYGGD